MVARAKQNANRPTQDEPATGYADLLHTRRQKRYHLHDSYRALLAAFISGGSEGKVFFCCAPQKSYCKSCTSFEQLQMNSRTVVESLSVNRRLKLLMKLMLAQLTGTRRKNSCVAELPNARRIIRSDRIRSEAVGMK